MRLPDLNRLQRGILIGAALTIAFIQLVMFDEHGVDGYGWVLSVLAIAVLLLVAFAPRGKDQRFRVSWQPPKGPVADTAQTTVQNMRLITEATARMSRELTSRFPDVQTNKGSFAEVSASMSRSSLLMYCLGLLSVCKLRRNGDFLLSDEYRTTRAAVARAAADTDYEVLKGALSGDERPPVDSYLQDFVEIELGVREFFASLQRRNTSTPAHRLNAWLNTRCAVNAIPGISMESLAKETMRRMYGELFGSDPGDDQSIAS